MNESCEKLNMTITESTKKIDINSCFYYESNGGNDNYLCLETTLIVGVVRSLNDRNKCM